jgi:hypothetical protein
MVHIRLCGEFIDRAAQREHTGWLRLYLDVLCVLEDDLVLEGDLAREEVHDAQLVELALDLLRLVLGEAQQNLKYVTFH